MNSTRFTRPAPLLLLGSTLFANGCLGAASSLVTESGADYGVSEAVTENATTPPEERTRPSRHLRASLSMPYFSFAQVLRPRS
ncbi:hypothetical protein [Xanthomonas hortorum]|uniref:Secreted protein n=1 Tax=Xanthomonas hortorum pv. gardneri TaxID=2754056 RepID=A0A6V7DUS1_9XANT|nr:hypothetical protein [Xanthomonas hortorum]APP80225.1 hypothetical protein BJD10_11330 [Xanthomonas hortorum pv. gardneri]KLA97100.1 hypothetical protein SM17710_14895 [Xanthomonas hortorum pv. gardneri]KLA97585.1 hypothetical protein SM18210_18870 [Xanthomonas hortorum pv. gardneri]KLB07364.1 hypothetical protein SM23410_18385 [Xanthomonas hortorum pv. gardneri]KLB10443.1 hypothetical protein SM22010_11465 [Xanthomonas hortorum pv. gardneri]